MAVHRSEVRAHRHHGYVAPPGFAPRRDVVRPLVVTATVLLDGLEAECVGIPSEVDKFGFDPRLDLDRLGLRPARKQETVGDPGRPLECGLAEATQPDRNFSFRPRQAGSRYIQAWYGTWRPGTFGPAGLFFGMPALRNPAK